MDTWVDVRLPNPKGTVGATSHRLPTAQFLQLTQTQHLRPSWFPRHPLPPQVALLVDHRETKCGVAEALQQLHREEARRAGGGGGGGASGSSRGASGSAGLPGGGCGWQLVTQLNLTLGDFLWVAVPRGVAAKSTMDSWWVGCCPWMGDPWMGGCVKDVGGWTVGSWVAVGAPALPRQDMGQLVLHVQEQHVGQRQA